MLVVGVGQLMQIVTLPDKLFCHTQCKTSQKKNQCDVTESINTFFRTGLKCSFCCCKLFCFTSTTFLHVLSLLVISFAWI